MKIPTLYEVVIENDGIFKNKNPYIYFTVRDTHNITTSREVDGVNGFSQDDIMLDAMIHYKDWKVLRLGVYYTLDEFMDVFIDIMDPEKAEKEEAE